MFYRLNVNLNFDIEQIPQEAYTAAKFLLDKAIVINRDQPNEERGYIQLQQCFHDEDPSKSCILKRHVEPD